MQISIIYVSYILFILVGHLHNTVTAQPRNKFGDLGKQKHIKMYKAEYAINDKQFHTPPIKGCVEFPQILSVIFFSFCLLFLCFWLPPLYTTTLRPSVDF